jgi:hypothetical protein
LNNETIKESVQLTNLYFQPEAPEKSGRVDVKIISEETLRDGKSYYVIECKRLNKDNQNWETGLNGKYISNGIARFITEEKYPFYNNTAGMIGFVVSKMAIHENVGFINQLLKVKFTDINTEKELTQKQIAPGFDYSYYSLHKIDNATKTLYHLMFDFSDNIT